MKKAKRPVAKEASSAYSRQTQVKFLFIRAMLIALYRGKIASILDTLNYPHLESPQFKHVLQPSIITTAAVLHFAHSCAPSGKCDFEKASVCLVRASNSARFSCTIVR